MKVALAGAALGAVFQGIWGFCKELGGEECFGSGFDRIKEDWGVKAGFYFMGIDKFYQVVDPSILTGFSIVGILITIAELLLIFLFIFKNLPKSYIISSLLFSFSIACQVIYLYCDFTNITKHCPRNFVLEYLKQDFTRILIPEVLQLIKDLNLNPQLIEVLSCLGLIFTISQLIIIAKHLIGSPITIFTSLLKSFIEFSLLSLIIFLVLQNFSDLPQSFPFHDLKSTIEQLIN